MAKIRRNGPKIKNAHLIGAGRAFTAVRTGNKINWRASVVKQAGGIPKKPALQKTGTFKTPAKLAIKTTGSHTKMQSRQTWKAPTPSKTRFSRFKAASAKMQSKPISQIKQISRTPLKPPKRSR